MQADTGSKGGAELFFQVTFAAGGINLQKVAGLLGQRQLISTAPVFSASKLTTAIPRTSFRSSPDHCDGGWDRKRAPFSCVLVLRMLGTEKRFPTGNRAAVRSCNEGESRSNLFVDVLQSSGMNCKNKFLVLK